MFHKKRRIACILYLVLLFAVIILAFIVSPSFIQPPRAREHVVFWSSIAYSHMPHSLSVVELEVQQQQQKQQTSGALAAAVPIQSQIAGCSVRHHPAGAHRSDVCRRVVYGLVHPLRPRNDQEHRLSMPQGLGEPRGITSKKND